MLGEESERYIILLLGVKDKPISSMERLQKEMFVASRTISKINEIFDFEKHHHDPYSQTLQEITKNPPHLVNMYKIQQDGSISITTSGKDYFNKIINQYKGNEKFASLLQVLKLTRSVYDKLEQDELSFLIYMTYPDYADTSNIYHKVMNYEKNRDRIANLLLSKRLITKERYDELRN